MELTCAIVLVIGSLVSATPHGYGTKGGASAKAEASAVAGSFSGLGVVPINIPNGAGYSGSYSKSSSSSFSSASASSSSSSFSYNGVGPSGFSGSAPFGSVTPSAACGSAGCQFDGREGLGSQGSSGAGAGSQAYSGANAAASAAAGSLAGCGSSGCQSSRGTGSHATSTTGSGSQANDNANAAPPAEAECGSEGCKYGGSNGLTHAVGSSFEGNSNSNAAAELSKSSQNVGLNQPYACEGSNCNKPSSTENKCTSGQCGSSSGIHDKCASGQCETASQTVAPSTDYGSNDILVTGSGVSGSKHSYDSKGQSNSNYDRPFSIGHAPGCSNGNCGPAESSHSKPYFPHASSNTNEASGSSNQNHQPAICNSPNCKSVPESGNVITPGYFKPATHLTTPKQESGCSTTNCQSESDLTQPPIFVPVNPHESAQSGGNTQTLPTSYFSPPYGPIDCAGGKCTGSSSTNGDYAGSPGYKHPSCAPGTPNCAGSSLSGSLVPSHNAPSDKFPSSHSDAGSHVSGSGLPSYNLPSTSFPTGQANAESHSVASGVPQHNAPSTELPSVSLNTGSQLPVPSQTYNAPSTGLQTSQSYAGSHALGNGASSPITPSTGFPLSESGGTHIFGSGLSSHNVPSTGFAAGSTGSLSSPFGAGSHNAGSVISSYNTLSPSGTIASCKTSNCGEQLFQMNPQPGYFGITKPISSSSQKLPPYTGGFGGPSGILKPHEYSVPASDYYNKPTTPSGTYNPINSSPTSCYSGNCGSKPGYTPPAYATAGTGVGVAEFGVGTSNTACNTPDCDKSHQTPSIQPGSHDVANPTDGSSSTNQKLPAYTGGFGGPVGLLKPNEYNVPKPTTPSGIINPTSCSSGSCGSQPGHTSPSYALSSTGSQATASAEANANAVAYTGGFGGPPGLLKPYDSGKVGSSGLSGKHILGSEFSAHQAAANGATSLSGSKTFGIGSHVGVGAQASAVAQASATSGANSGAYGGSTHGENDGSGFKTTGGCGGGCGSAGRSYNGDNYFGASGGLGYSKLGSLAGTDSSLTTSGASAKSQASAASGAGVFGLGSSYASSSATAHASSGAAVKGGYGRR